MKSFHSHDTDRVLKRYTAELQIIADESIIKGVFIPD
jgi:hypothetical protein